MNTKQKLEAYKRAADLSKTRHEFANHSVADGQELHGWKITIHQYEEPFTLGHLGFLATAKHDKYDTLYQTGSSEKEVRDAIVLVIKHEVATLKAYDGKPTPEHQLFGLFLCGVSAIIVLGIGLLAWLWLAPLVEAWWLG